VIVDTLPNGLRDLQVLGAVRIHQGRSHILADQPGAGKTLQGLVAVEADGQFISPAARILITAPKTACQLMWARELEVRIASQYAVVIADLTGPCGTRRKGGASMAERNEYLGRKMIEAHDLGLPLIVLTNFDGLHWKYGSTPKLGNLWQNRWSTIIIDEAHLVLPSSADDPKGYTQFWYGLSQLVTTADPIRLSMTGTPDNGKLQNRFGHYRFLHPGKYQSYWSWVKYFFYTQKNGWGGLDVFGLQREEDWNAYQQQVMTRRTKEEMLEHLPRKQWINVELPLTPEHRERYDEYEREILEQIQDLQNLGTEEATRTAQGLAFSYALRARQLAVTDWWADQDGKWHPKGDADYSSLLAWLEEWLTERGHHEKSRDDSLGKVVITGYLVEELQWLQAELEKAGFGRIPILSGDTSLPEKQRLEQEFQRGELRALLFSGHIGVSISLDAADDMIFVDFVHDPDKIEQTEDRTHRASSTGHKFFWRLIPEDTIVEEIVHAVDERYRVTRKSYDGSRGVDFRRRMLHAEDTTTERITT
jgi:superfamily II DNA or RNA helicase